MKPLSKRSNTICKSVVFILSILSLISLSASSAISKQAPPWVKCRVETDRAVLPAGGPHKTVVKITLDAPPAPSNIERPPVNLALVLDRSGSMGGSKIERAKEAAIEALRRLGPGDMFSVVIYDHNVQTIVPAQNARNLEWIESRIREIRPGGNTALFGGVSQGAAEIRKNLNSNYVHRIILLSDGLANVGPSTPEDLGRLGAALIKENISVTTIGVGTDYNEDLMARLSQKSDGNIYFVESSVDLPSIFAAELGNVLSVVAKKVKLTIEVPEGVTPLKIIGREGRIKGRKVELSMNQLYGDQEKYALVEVEIPAALSGKEMEIARASAAYENPFSHQNEIAKGRSVVQFSDNLERVQKSENAAVVKEYELNLNAIVQEKAITLADEGRNEEAVIELKRSAAKLKSIGDAHKDDDLLKEAADLEEQAEVISQKGMSKRSRKSLRTRSYQMKNQQMR